jgi:pyruvate dehydrogenase E2 component (dihydrolipoamide acetyltransferase)
VQLKGTGPRGRIQEQDVQEAARSMEEKSGAARAPRPPEKKEPEIITLQGMRKTIARRIQESYQEAPHITLTMDVPMTDAVSFRNYANQRLGENEKPITITALIIKACAWALKQHPMVNSHFIDESISVMPDVNIGMAVALEEGLIVPVIKNCGAKGLLEIGREVNDLAERARKGALKPDDVADGTFTVSNLGMYGIRYFTPIINPPQVAILAVGAIENRFVPDEENRPIAMPVMSMSLSADHRVLDGAAAARFVAEIRDALVKPAAMVL